MAHVTGLSHSRSWKVLETWHLHTPALLTALETPAFVRCLDEVLQAITGFDQSCIFLYPASGRPILLHDNLQGIPETGAMQRYINGAYLLDPVYTACAHGREAGLYRMAELAPDAFFEGEYFNSPDVHPCISLASGSLAEEIVFLSPLPGGMYAAYSLMRCNGSAAFSDEEVAALGLCQPALEAMFQRHHGAVAKAATGARPARSIAEQLDAAFSGFATERLTAREQAIVGLILRGHSSLSIALHLEIAEGTVKNHRKHLYSKLGISSQSELFHLFVNHLLGTEPAEPFVQTPLTTVGARLAGEER
ncbi:response regulator transcription factor [Pseudomonas alkylphenolica]|uniref:response regulator transcription factor n=1 Tax=Pseudomonas alkylphenolica TaxID=237609 RepID=UPI0018D6BA36|nr:helix-turn-helix transcriptional regulator [Pseudomonas alkylphenolica]MBH3430944.1 LuxR family transcriptional regulator [Pseudomonas alkylphenolica]